MSTAWVGWKELVSRRATTPQANKRFWDFFDSREYSITGFLGRDILNAIDTTEHQQPPCVVARIHIEKPLSQFALADALYRPQSLVRKYEVIEKAPRIDAVTHTNVLRRGVCGSIQQIKSLVINHAGEASTARLIATGKMLRRMASWPTTR